MLFNELPEWIRITLRDLSRQGFIYLGRTGAGLSGHFRSECMKLGTIKALEKWSESITLAEKLLIEDVAVKGPKWVSYEDLKGAMESSVVFQALREKI
jgi:hypothetical protein